MTAAPYDAQSLVMSWFFLSRRAGFLGQRSGDEEGQEKAKQRWQGKAFSSLGRTRSQEVWEAKDGEAKTAKGEPRRATSD